MHQEEGLSEEKGVRGFICFMFQTEMWMQTGLNSVDRGGVAVDYTAC